MMQPTEVHQHSGWPDHKRPLREIVDHFGRSFMANHSLPQSTLDTFQPISASAVHVLARMAARRAVQEGLRAQGVRVSLVKPAEISARAQVYLLYQQALERAQRMGMYEKPKRRRGQVA
jgi:hypothetical protein